MRYRLGSRGALDPMVQLVSRGAPDAEVLYLGDSVVGRVAREDTDTRPLGEMVADELRPRTCAWSWYSAYHLDTLLEQYRAVIRAGWRPRHVLVPINLRGFSPQWWGNPPWAYRDHRRAMRRYRGRMVHVWSPMPTTRETARHRARPLGSPLLDGWRVGDAEDVRDGVRATDDAERQRVLFAFHLGVPITADHPRLLALRELERAAAADGVALCAYVTPLNVEAARRHGGDELVTIIRANVALVGGLDLSELLGSDRFFHADDPTEHLNQHGRLELARRLAGALGG